MPLRPRPEVESLASCPHGGLNYAELERLGIDGDSMLDFSVSSNPYGPPPGVRLALRGVPVDVYPDSECTAFRRALGEKSGVPVQNIIAGSGSIELLRLVVLAFLRVGDTAIIPAPTFGEYEVACRLLGGSILPLALREGNGFRIEVNELAAMVRRSRPRLVFLCNPNNPTGWYLSSEEVLTVLRACEDTLLILDEAYAGFVDDAWESVDLIHEGNLLVLRSMTKDYALAGLRLGYGVASEAIVGPLRKVCPPWNVNSLAQRAGVAALMSGGYLERCKARIGRAQRSLKKDLAHLGLTVFDSPANYFLVKVGDAQCFRSALLQKGVLVRDCTSFGLPQYVRIGVRSMPENRRLVRAVEEILQCR